MLKGKIVAEVIELDIRAKSQEAQQELDKVNKQILELKRTASLVPIKGNGAQINAEISLATQKAKALALNLREARLDSKLNPQVETLTSTLSSAIKKSFDLKTALSSAVGFAVGNLAVNAISGIASSFGDAITGAREFSKEIARINSTLPDGIRVTKQQQDALRALGDDFATTGTQQAAGFFEIVSNGVEDTSKAFDILRNANEAALGGITDTDTAARVITATLNAYERQGVTAAEVTDSLVVATQLSGIKFEALASSIGRVTALAANSNVSIGELSGTLAFLNKNALTTEQAITGVRGIINAIIKPSDEATQIANRLGIGFNAAALESKGLVQFLKEVNTATKGNSAQLARLFGDINAINSVIAIAKGGFDNYSESVKLATNSQGAASKASNEVKKSLDFSLARQEASVKNLGIAFGDFLRPAIILTSDVLTDFFKVLGSAFATKGPNDLNQQLNKTNAIISALESKDFYRLQNLGIETNVLTTSKLNALLDAQILKRNTLQAQISSQKPAAPAAAAAEELPVQREITDRERQLQADLTAIKIQGIAERAAIDLETKNTNALIAEEGFITQTELELEQAALTAEAAYQAELAKNALITDAYEQALANKIAFQKKSDALDKAEATAQAKGAKARLALEQTFRNQQNAIIGQSFGLASALAADGSKAQFLIQKAAALAQVAVARGTAIAAIPAQTSLLPAPAVPAAAAKLLANANISAAIGAATIAASAIKGFESGGIIGNPSSGATAGPDNRLATVRDGEMILNAQQQKTLFETIDSGTTGNQPIIIQIDGREIARAVRNQVQQGFALA